MDAPAMAEQYRPLNTQSVKLSSNDNKNHYHYCRGVSLVLIAEGCQAADTLFSDAG